MCSADRPIVEGEKGLGDNIKLPNVIPGNWQEFIHFDGENCWR